MFQVINKPTQEIKDQQIAVEVKELHTGEIEFAPLIWVEEYGEYHAIDERFTIKKDNVGASENGEPRFITYVTSEKTNE